MSSILHELSSDDGQVVDFTVSDDRENIEIRESCDSYFFKKLNKEKFLMFIKELESLSSEMIGSDFINRKARSFEYNVECVSRMTGQSFSIVVTAASIHAAITEVAKSSKDFNEGHYSVINCTIMRSIE